MMSNGDKLEGGLAADRREPNNVAFVGEHGH